MENHVPCFCNKERVDPEDATLVLNGIPICNEQCLRKAEQHFRRTKGEPQKKWDVT